MAIGAGTVSGGVRIAPEASYGTTGTYVDIHTASATVGLRRSLARPVRLSRGAPGFGAGSPVNEYMSAWVDGEIVAPFTTTETILGGLLGAGSAVLTKVYSFGQDAAPTSVAMSVDVIFDDGVLSYEFTGCKPTSYRFDFAADQNATVTVGIVGGILPTAGTTSITRPSDSVIMMPSGASSFTIGTTAIGVKSGSITVELPTSSSERHTIGQAFIKEPVRNGPCLITGSLLLDLDDATGFDSKDVLTDFLAGTALGTIEMGGSFLTADNCLMVGDAPSLAPGIPEFPINFDASDCIVTMV